ncbi:hypothetical protein BASA62_007758 [Batrachochytrium salamandrivorans]|nr:hypothetical protein BASA62_007758 [Batrachochytrium salamandrivorans]
MSSRLDGQDKLRVPTKKREKTMSRSSINPDSDSASRDEIIAVSRVNALLARIHVPITIASISECVSSLWVAILEGLFETRLPGVVGMSNTTSESSESLRRSNRLQNAQAVIWVLEMEVLHSELPHIKAEDVVDGDPHTLVDLIDIIWELSQALEGGKAKSPEILAHLTEDHADNSGRPSGILDEDSADSVIHTPQMSEIGDGQHMDSLEDISTINSQESMSDDLSIKPLHDYPTHRSLLPSSELASSILALQRAQTAFRPRRDPSLSTVASGMGRAQKKNLSATKSTGLRIPSKAKPNHRHDEALEHSRTSKRATKHSNPPMKDNALSDRVDGGALKRMFQEREVDAGLTTKNGITGDMKRPSFERNTSELYSPIRGSDRSGTSIPENVTPRSKFDGKHIQFCLPDEKYSTPPILQVLSNDTPYTKALKIRRAMLLRQKHAVSGRSPLILQAKLKRMRKQHQRVLKSGTESRLFRESSFTDLPDHRSFQDHYHPSETKEDEWDSLNHKEQTEEYSKSSIDSHGDLKNEDNKRVPKHHSKMTRGSTHVPNNTKDLDSLSQAEHNILNFESRVRRMIPLVHTRLPSEPQRERLWNSQLKTWVHALDDQIWTQKVEQKKKHTELGNKSLVYFAQTEAAKAHNLSMRKAQNFAKNKAKVDLDEQVRRVKRMERLYRTAEEEANRIADQRKFKEENMVKGLMDEYIKSQRTAILEERRFAKDIQNSREAERKLKEISQHNLYPFFIYISLLSEQLADAKRDEAMVKMAQQEEIRALVREQKEHSKNRIRQVKQKLNQDWSDVHFEENAASLIRKNLSFRIVPSRRQKQQ